MSAMKNTVLALALCFGFSGTALSQPVTQDVGPGPIPPPCTVLGTAAGQCPQGGVITGAGPIGSSTVVPVITYNAAGQLTTVTTATIAGTTDFTATKLPSGSGATYSTPAGARQLLVRMWGGGGGGSGTGSTGPNNGGTGGTTIFNSINANGGSGGGQINGGAGGTAGTGTTNVLIRISGAPGVSGGNVYASATNTQSVGGAGGGNGGGVNGGSGVANSGGGGAGGAGPSVSFATASGNFVGAGGGQGEYVELLIPSPAATYTYTIGAVGSAGSAGTSGNAGGAGGTGYAIVQEFY